MYSEFTWWIQCTVDLWISWILWVSWFSWICGFCGFADFVDFSVLTSCDSNYYRLWHYVLFASPTVIMVEPILIRTVILLISFSEIENLDSTEMYVHRLLLRKTVSYRSV